ncbi:tetratricopeptide repeat protein [candidate division KSB1 bacterium]|nr:tetratricopeptide repeat protein [candidate division KSB1 bacterium]
MKYRKNVTYFVVLCLFFSLVQSGYAQKATEWFQKGTKTTNPNEKIQFYLKSIELDPNLIEAHYNLAYVYKNKEEHTKALDAFKKALDLSQSKSDDKLKLTILYELGICYKKLEKHSEALKMLDEAKKLAKDEKIRSSILFEAGRISIQLEAFDQAIKYFEEGTLVSKNNKEQFEIAIAHAQKEKQVHTFYHQGLDLLGKKSYQPAIEAFSKVVELDPNYKDANIRLVELQHQQQNLQESAAIAKVDELTKDANLLFLQKNYQAALAKYLQISEISPFNSKCYYNIGTCYERLNDQKMAITAYQKALLIKSNFTDALNALSRLGGKMLDEEVKDASLNRANSLVMQKKYDEAIAEYKNYIKKEPLNFQTQVNLGFCYEQKNEPQLARQHYENALKMNETSTNALEGRARVEKLIKDEQAENLKNQIDDDVDFERYGVAHARLQQYLQLIPDDKWALDKLQVVENALEKQNQTEMSRDFAKKTPQPVFSPASDSTTQEAANETTSSMSAPNGLKNEWWIYLLIVAVILAAIIVLVSRKKKTEPEIAAISQEIKNISVHKFLSDCHSTKRTGIVTIATQNGPYKKIEGKIYLKNGNIVRANCDEIENVDALYRLFETEIPDRMLFQETNFSDEGNIYQATMPLLVQWQIKQEKK